MRVSSSKSLFVLLALAAAFLIAPVAHADIYKVVGITTDNSQFYGITASGATIFYSSFGNCGYPGSGCYDTYVDGTLTGRSDVAPTLTLDDTQGSCANSAHSCSVSNNGFSATISPVGHGTTDLFATNAANPSQWIATGDIGGIFAISGTGDIVFDQQGYGNWEEAINVTPIGPTPSVASTVPEPTSLLLLATGILALGFTVKMGGVTL